MRYILISSMLLLLATVSFRSPLQITVKGNVKDVKGKSLMNVLVKEKDTKNFVTTDINGQFIISVKNGQSNLQLSAAGFETVSVSVPSNLNMYVVLKHASSKLEEITFRNKSHVEDIASVLPNKTPGIMLSEAVVIGYGTSRKMATNSRSYESAGIKHRVSPSADSHYKSGGYYNTEDYGAIVENRFLSVGNNPLSTFSIDVDAASYSNVRRYIQSGNLPPAGSVRIEEMINYFTYDYPKPLGNDPFSINTEIAACPWNAKHQLVLVGLQGKKIATENLPSSNIVFLIDVSGSMMSENKLPLVKASLKLLVDQLREQDKVSIVVYAGSAGLVLSPTGGSEKMKIKNAVDMLEAGGSTAGGEGIKLAYRTAVNNFITGGNNRVILCTDGDFNVGVSNDAELERIVENERKSGVFLTVLGYGMGNYKDNKMQKLADKGNGNHAYIDGFNEAKKVLVNEFGGTLFTIAKDVKLQVEFNPAKLQSYRLIGYENRLLQKEDFNNDARDAGELGSGHVVTALYEIIPVGEKNEFYEKVDALKYQQEEKQRNWVTKNTGELMNIKFRYKKPTEDVSKLIEHAVLENAGLIKSASTNFRFAAAVAQFGMLLSNSEFKQSSSYASTLQLAKDAIGKDAEGYRNEFVQLLKNAQLLVTKHNSNPEDNARIIVR